MKQKVVQGKREKKTSGKTTGRVKAKSNPAVAGKNPQLFPIVAIGASAGGLEAMTELIRHLPADTGMAFIYAQHLSPDHDSMLAEILSNSSSMPVEEVTDMALIEPGKVFVMPSDKEMNVVNGHIKLTPRSENRGANILIDIFFTSLAEKHRERVIGIILSGSAQDGTRGMKAIKFEGGVTFAQDDTAKFNSMPRSAIAAGVVDFILPPKKIAKELIRLSQHPFIKAPADRVPPEDEIDNGNTDLKSVIQLLHRSFGVNFGLYKMNTIKRRILRRMLLNKVKTLKEYAAMLQGKKEETDILYNDLLINVTHFFRDAEASRYLKAALLPKLLRAKKPGEALRIWVTGCSTGEEAYSLAIMLLELQDRQTGTPTVQIFATDLSAQAISKARIGTYSRQEVEMVSPKRLQRFFRRSSAGFRITQEVRDMCVFAPHNVLSDPPFSRIDLVSCCNLLIYFDVAAQKKAMATFHYSLNPDGYLLLGKSETVGSAVNLFSPVNKKLKIYTRKKNSGTGNLPTPDTRFSRLSLTGENIPDGLIRGTKTGADTSGIDQAVNTILLSRYAPASVVINQQMEILQFRGAASLYLEHPEGRASLNILRMARPEIAFELRNAITKTMKTGKAAQKKGIESAGGTSVISLEVVPLDLPLQETALLIVFSHQEKEPQAIPAKNTKTANAVNQRKLVRMEEEIAAYRDELRSIGHNHEAAMEELQSANEEVVSSNEELRSINEELETSKEEIQSANEELATTNQELQTRNELLNESYNYSEAIISTIHDPMVVLDKDLRVKTANQSFYRRFRMAEEETEGMSLFDLGGRSWNIPGLRELLEDTLTKSQGFNDFEVQKEFPKIGRVVLLFNGRRIIQRAHREQLILLAIADITDTRDREDLEKKQLQDRVDSQTLIAEASQRADDYIRTVFMQAPVSIVVYKGARLVIDIVNTKGQEMWGKTLFNAIGKTLSDVAPALPVKDMEKIVKGVYQSGKPHIAHEIAAAYPVNNEDDDTHYLNFVAKPLFDERNKIAGVVTIGVDVTEEVIARRKTEESEMRYHNLIYSSTSMIAILKGEEMIIEIANDAILESWGKTRDVVGKSLLTVLPEMVAQGFSDHLARVYKTGKPFYAYELPVLLNRNDKEELVYYTFVYEAQKSIDGIIEGVAIMASEVTPQAMYRKQIKENEQRYSLLTKALTQVVWIADNKGAFIEHQHSWEDYTGQPWEEQKGWGWLNMIHEADRERIATAFKQALLNGIDYKSEGRVWSKRHQAFRYFEAAGVPMRGDEGTIKEWISTITDIHEQKLAAQRLQDAARQFRFIADAMPQKVWTADAMGNRNYFNQQWSHYTGVTSEELITNGMEQVIHPDDIEKTRLLWAESIATGNVFDTEIRVRAKDGRYGWHLSRGEGYKDENGNITLWVGTHTEIQKQKLQALEFEQAVHQRTKELLNANNELAEKNAALKKVNKELESFAYVSSHDLQEPLRKIQTFVNLISKNEKSLLSDKGRDYFQRINTSAQRMQALIEDLLTFSRIGVAVTQPELVDLGKIVEEVKIDLKESIEEKNAILEIKEICSARIIPFQFKQLMTNLLSNALKFAEPARRPHIIIESKPVTGKELKGEFFLAHQEYCHIRVTDNGIGFEQEFEEQVFEVFQRLHDRDTYPGTGIGLAIAKKIVENHNGSISASSELNKGTSFDIYLPQ